jgi:O-antigen/teichoic acid export membrane protein
VTGSAAKRPHINEITPPGPVLAAGTFFGSLAQILSGQFACGAVALLTEVLYARLLGPAARGTISLCVMSIGFAGMIGGLGGEGSITFWSSRSNRNHSAWLPSVLLWGIAGTCLTCAFWLAAYWRFRLPFLRGISPTDALLVLANIPAAILFAYCMAFLTGLEDFRLRSIGALLRQLTAVLGFLLFVVIAGRMPEAALWGSLIGLLSASIVTLVIVRANLAGFWKIQAAAHNLRPTLIYGLRGQVGSIATFFTYRLDVFVVNYFLQPAQLGFYVLGVVISEALWQIPQAAASALFPRTARTQELTGLESTRFTCSILRRVFFITLLCGILIAAVSPIAIPLIFGANFKPSVSVVFWILPGTIALSMGKVACADLAGRGKNGYGSVFALICFVITIALDWFLIPRFGIVGAAIASSVAYFTDAVLILLAVRHELLVTWKQMLIPTREDIFSYREAWHRAVMLLTFDFSNRPRVRPGLSPAGDD